MEKSDASYSSRRTTFNWWLFSCNLCSKSMQLYIAKDIECILISLCMYHPIAQPSEQLHQSRHLEKGGSEQADKNIMKIHRVRVYCTHLYWELFIAYATENN